VFQPREGQTIQKAPPSRRIDAIANFDQFVVCPHLFQIASLFGSDPVPGKRVYHGGGILDTAIMMGVKL